MKIIKDKKLFGILIVVYIIIFILVGRVKFVPAKETLSFFDCIHSFIKGSINNQNTFSDYIGCIIFISIYSIFILFLLFFPYLLLLLVRKIRLIMFPVSHPSDHENKAEESGGENTFKDIGNS